MRTSELIIGTNPAPDDIQYLEDRIYEFNSAATGLTDGEWLAIFVRDANDRIIAGICGALWGGCLEIRQFWVEESLRRQGMGTRLLDAAEQEALRRGCGQILLATFSFQAPDFYAKHGFEVVAAVDDHPRGHTNLILRKYLGPTAFASPARGRGRAEGAGEGSLAKPSHAASTHFALIDQLALREKGTRSLDNAVIAPS